MSNEESEFLYDLSRWKESYLHKTESDFINSLNSNGIHQINLYENPLHVFTENIEGGGDYILVGFSGAVTERKKKQAPFFSFLNVAREIKLGLIAISDPSLNLSEDLNLAWYLGNHINVHLTEVLASILDSVIKKTGKKLILSGGSGGGFAALNIHTKMKEKHMAKCFVWNPQTDTTLYGDSALIRYFNTCYPSNKIDKKNVNDIKEFFIEKNIPYNVKKDENLYQLIFINGYDPNHIRKHVSRLYPVDEKDNNFVYFGDWGYGHIQPKLSIVKNVISLISQDFTFNDIVVSLEQPEKKLLDFEKHKDDVRKRMAIRAVVIKKGSESIVNLRCNLIEFYMGFQLKFSIISKDEKTIYCSGYLLRSNKGEVFISGKNYDLKKIKDSIISVHVEDHKGIDQLVSYKFIDINEYHNSVDGAF